MDIRKRPAAALIHPRLGDDRYRAGDYRLREIGRRVVHKLSAHPGNWREGAALEGGLMSSVANWSYTATATIWRKLEGNDEYGDPLGYAEPEQILCDYEGGLSKKLASLGAEIVVKNTVWTEFALAAAGDYLLIGVSTESDPVVAGADEVRQVIRYADTFERVADDYAILTGI